MPNKGPKAELDPIHTRGRDLKGSRIDYHHADLDHPTSCWTFWKPSIAGLQGATHTVLTVDADPFWKFG
jgi:hypothetical protein